MEIWKDIRGYEGLYQVSNLGRIKSFKTKNIKIMTPKDDIRGYLQVQLRNKEGIRRTIKVHRLVAETFIPNPDNKPEIDHINTIRTDNNSENLKWVTHKENANNPLTIQHYKEKKNIHRKPTPEQINKILETKRKNRENGIRVKGKNVICITTGKIFISAKLASEYYNIRSSEIIACCRGKRKSCGKLNGQKLHWKYL